MTEKTSKSAKKSQEKNKTDLTNEGAWKRFFEKLEENQIDMDPEMAEMINRNFGDLI